MHIPFFRSKAVFKEIQLFLFSLRFLNGNTDLKEYIENNIRYPMASLDMEIGGKTFLSFYVNPDKTISDITVVEGVDPLIEKECERVIKTMRDMWNPGAIDGKKIPVSVTIGINFETKAVIYYSRPGKEDL